MKSPAWPLQKAILARLKSRLSVEVYDHVDNEAPFPFVAIGEDTEVDWSAKSEPGEEVTHTIHIYSRWQGMKEAKDIKDQVVRALTEDWELDLGDEFRIVLHRLDSANSFREDEKTRHSVVRFRYLIEELRA